MGEKVTVNLDQSQVDGLNKVQEAGKADNASEAARVALNAGLVELGMLNGTGDNVWLLREVGKLWAYLGVGWLGFTLFYPVSLRIWVVVFFVGALVMFGAAEASERGVFDGLGRGAKDV